MAQQTKHAQHPASSPSRPRRPGAGVAGGSGPRRAFHCGARRSCRWSECRKSLQAPGLGAFRRLTRGGDCVQEESEYENAAYHQGGSGHEEAHVEDGLLFQPLQEGASEDQAIREKANLATLCRDELKSRTSPSQRGACARYVSFWSEVEKGYNWAKSHIKRLIRSAVHFVKTQYVSWKELVGRLETAFHVGKEVFGYGKCIYELATAKGACGDP
jgi:hypothetical protein